MGVGVEADGAFVVVESFVVGRGGKIISRLIGRGDVLQQMLSRRGPVAGGNLQGGKDTCGNANATGKIIGLADRNRIAEPVREGRGPGWTGDWRGERSG